MSKILVIYEELPDFVSYYISNNDYNNEDEYLTKYKELLILNGIYFNHIDFNLQEDEFDKVYNIYEKYFGRQQQILNDFTEIKFPINLNDNTISKIIHIGFFL